MKNVYIYCEGSTEESFINEVMYPYLLRMDIAAYPIICTTKRTRAHKYTGGVSDYSKIAKELKILCKCHKREYITTMFDYYALPANTPGMDCDLSDIHARVKYIEKMVNADIGQENCMFHIMPHEFESLLFSMPDAFSQIADAHTVKIIRSIKDSYPTPEHINNSPVTAPSKRLKELIPHYAKIRNGTQLSKYMGIDVMLESCPHFCEWIRSIVSIANNGRA